VASLSNWPRPVSVTCARIEKNKWGRAQSRPALPVAAIFRSRAAAAARERERGSLERERTTLRGTSIQPGTRTRNRTLIPRVNPPRSLACLPDCTRARVCARALPLLLREPLVMNARDDVLQQAAIFSS